MEFLDQCLHFGKHRIGLPAVFGRDRFLNELLLHGIEEVPYGLYAFASGFLQLLLAALVFFFCELLQGVLQIGFLSDVPVGDGGGGMIEELLKIVYISGLLVIVP